jgi:hypothetical protein
LIAAFLPKQGANMIDEETALETIIASWGSDESKEQLVELLNEHYCFSNSLSDLCDGDHDNVDYLEVLTTEETKDEYRASVMIDFDKVTTPGCKDANNLEPRTGYVDVSIPKDFPYIDISVATVNEPDGDYY